MGNEEKPKYMCVRVVVVLMMSSKLFNYGNPEKNIVVVQCIKATLKVY